MGLESSLERYFTSELIFWILRRIFFTANEGTIKWELGVKKPTWTVFYLSLVTFTQNLVGTLHKKFPRFPADLVKFTEEILNRKRHFCSVVILIKEVTYLVLIDQHIIIFATSSSNLLFVCKYRIKGKWGVRLDMEPVPKVLPENLDNMVSHKLLEK